MRSASVPGACAIILLLAASTSAEPAARPCPTWPADGQYAIVVFVNNVEPRAPAQFAHAWGYPSIFNTATPVCSLAPDTYCVALVDTTMPHVLFYTIDAARPVTGDTRGAVWLRPGHLYKAVPWGDMLSDRGRYRGVDQLNSFGYPPGADLCLAPTF